jgi:hypothetical protein
MWYLGIGTVFGLFVLKHGIDSGNKYSAKEYVLSISAAIILWPLIVVYWLVEIAIIFLNRL